MRLGAICGIPGLLSSFFLISENQRMVEKALPTVIVYTRPGCHLCEDACEVLQRYGLETTLINIETDPDLVTRYGLEIPVVEIDGQVRFRGHVDEVLLRRLLKN